VENLDYYALTGLYPFSLQLLPFELPRFTRFSDISPGEERGKNFSPVSLVYRSNLGDLNLDRSLSVVFSVRRLSGFPEVSSLSGMNDSFFL